MLAIFKREFKSYFQNVIGWLFVAALLAVYGLYFYVYNLKNGYPYISYDLNGIGFIMMIAVPILTMRSLSDEKKTKTDQLMLTSPVSVGRIVAGKYFAMAAVYTIVIALFALSPLVLSIYGKVALSEAYVALFGYWLYGLSCIAVGLFISSISESVIISAILTFTALFLSYMMQSITGLISSSGNLLTKVLNCFDLYTPFENFVSGCFSVTSAAYYVTVISAFMLPYDAVYPEEKMGIFKEDDRHRGIFSRNDCRNVCNLCGCKSCGDSASCQVHIN